MVFGGLDVGTTGCKIALYSDESQLLRTYYKEYDVIRNNGQHEINFADVRGGVLELLKMAVKDYKVEALGITSFGETFAMLDENDNILAPSMLYTDPRGEAECKELCDVLGEERLTLLTGVKPHPMYSISKIMWHKNNNPEAFSKCKRILLGEDFIVYSITGKAQIDYSLAARTAAFDIEKKCWIEEIFNEAGVDASLMSEPVPAGTEAGVTTAEIKNILGIDYDITIVNGCHDQVAGMIGSGIFETYQAMDGTGTVECIPVILNQKPTDINFYEGGYSVVPYLGGQYACYALSFTGGATLKWFRDNFAELEWKAAENEGKNVYAELDSKVSDKPTGILVLPHFAGAATPYMDNDSKAAFIGVTLETTKYDLYKALMEGTSYEMLLNFNTMKAMTGEIEEIRATGGGATSDVWLQIKADILDTEITALSCKEVGAAGTAALAGLAVGVFTELNKAVEKMAPVRKVFKSTAENVSIYNELYKKYANLYGAVKGL
ncbi:MAG: FGGY family carbohydrate kinase [Oscillospiraceae bacterium]|nr:FGGY family carbohydrate kinase [Oscillospiraceae bacterium]